MNEFAQTDERLEQVKDVLRMALIKTGVIAMATNKRIVVRLDNEQQANILCHNLKYQRCYCQKKPGRKSAYWYAEVLV